MITQMQATNLKFQGERTLMNNNFEIMRLASRAGGSNPGQLTRDVFQLHGQEKSLAMSNIKANTQILFANAMLARAAKLREQSRELSKRLWAAGATFF